jgi:hypothetical protein
MSTDGKGIVVRQQDLREATRKKAEATTHKLKARLSKGEKRNRKRMATVASVYEVAPHLRTAEQIMGQDESAAPKRPKVQHKRVWASLRQTPAEVIEEMFAEAERRDPKHEERGWCWSMARKLNSGKSKRRLRATERTWWSFRISCMSSNTCGKPPTASTQMALRKPKLGAGARLRPTPG